MSLPSTGTSPRGSRRRFPRRNLRAEAYFHCRGRKYLAEIVDISVGGAFLELKECFGLAAELIRSHATAPIFVEIPRLQVRGASACVRHARSSGAPRDIGFGVSFDHIRPDIGYRLRYLAAL